MNPTYCFELIQEVTPDKRAAVRPLTSHHINHPSKTNNTYKTLLEKYGRTYKRCSQMNSYTWMRQCLADLRGLQLCSDTGCSPEDLPGTMDDKDGWRERIREIRAVRAI